MEHLLLSWTVSGSILTFSYMSANLDSRTSYLGTEQMVFTPGKG